MQVANLVDEGIHLCLEVGTKCFVESLDIARLSVTDTANELVLHVKDGNHQFVHLLYIHTGYHVGKYYTLCKKFSCNIIHLFLQNSSFHSFFILLVNYHFSLPLDTYISPPRSKKVKTWSAPEEDGIELGTKVGVFFEFRAKNSDFIYKKISFFYCISK